MAQELEVFDEHRAAHDAEPVSRRPAGAGRCSDSVQVKLSEMQLLRPRPLATAGWDACCGGNWVWIASGSGSCREDGAA